MATPFDRPRGNRMLLRREIGRRLRLARKDAHLTLVRAAELLEITRSMLDRIELGQGPVSVHLAREMARLYRIDDPDDELLNLVRSARIKGWWTQFGIANDAFIALEDGAERLSMFEPDLVPGPLQTAAYAAALFRAGMKRRTDEWIENQLEVRLIRQQRLTDEEGPLHVIAVVSEVALHRPVGGAEVMGAQLRHLALITELPTVTLHVLPLSVVSAEAMDGAFYLLDFPNGQQGMVYFEHLFGAERKEKPEQLSAARLRFNHLRGLALGTQESVALIERVAQTVWSG